MKKKSANGGFLGKSLSVFLSIALILSFMPTFSNATVAQAEETQGVEEGKQKTEEEFLDSVDGKLVSQEEATEKALSGGVYSIIDRSDVNSNVKESNLNFKKRLRASSVLPSSVDLRDFNGQNRVTSVKNQGSTGTCWAFAALATSETNIANATNQNATTDFSAFQPAYFAYDALSTDASKLKGTEVSQSGEGYAWEYDLLRQWSGLNMGGTTTQAASMLIQGSGPATSASVPFPDSSLNNGVLSSTLTPEQRRLAVAQLSKWSYLGSLVNTTYDTSGNVSYDSTNQTVLNRVKTELAEGNAVEISYWGGPNQGDPSLETYYNTQNNCQYTSDNNGTFLQPNHAVCVVGYDDNYKKENFNSSCQPPSDGAFIVKNSWGNYNTNSGYFYLSYWDHSIITASTYEYDTTNYDGDNIDANEEIIDQYDYTSAAAVYSLGAQSTEEFAQWYSNIYTASNNQKLHSIGTYYCSEGKTLSYKVYKLKDDATSPYDVAGNLSTPDAQGTYTDDYEGYATIKLDTPVELKKGEKYAILFSQTDDNGYYCAPQSFNYKDGTASNGVKYYEVNTVVNSGESFYLPKNSSTWKTISNMEISGLSFDNYCVKGYSTVQPYSVTFHNGDEVYDTQTANEGDSITKPADPTKEGYTFDGWYKDAEFTEPYDFENGVTENVELYAKFTINVYDVNFYDGSSLTSTQKVEHNSYAKEPVPAPTKNGYTFEGWYTKDGTTSGDWGSEFDFSETQITGTTNIYAKWTKDETVTYTVKFDTNGGSAVDAKTVNSGEAIAKPASDPTKAGYTFAGWYSDSALNTVFDFDTPITEDITLYAKWEVVTYTVTFEPDGGNVTPESQTFTIETGIATLPTPTKEGFTFEGWFAGEKQYTSIEKGTTGDITLTAKWSQNASEDEERLLQDGHTYFIFSHSSGKALGVTGGFKFNYAGISQMSLINSDAQQWKVQYDADDYITFINVNSGKALDITGGKASDGARLQQYTVKNTDSQKWKVEKAGEQYVIRSKADASFVLNLFGGWSYELTPINLKKANNSNEQKWTFFDITVKNDEVASALKTNSETIAAGSYEITPANSSYNALGIKKSTKSSWFSWIPWFSSDDSENVQVATKNNSLEQRWLVSFDDQGYARIKNLGSGKFLNVTGNSKLSGTNVGQYANTNSDAQKWIFVKNSNGTYKIVSALFPTLVLDVEGNGTISGTNVQVYNDNGTQAQQWEFASK